MGFPRQEYWSGLPFSTPGDLPKSRIKPASLVLPALVGSFFTMALSGKSITSLIRTTKNKCCNQKVYLLLLLSHFSGVRLFVTPGTGPQQAPLSMRFSRQEYWSRSPFPPPGESSPPRDQTCVSCVSCIDRQLLCMCCPGRNETFAVLKEKDEVDRITHSLTKMQALEWPEGFTAGNRC